MSDKPISRLRQRMIDDMTARRFKEKVQKDYLRHVRRFAIFLGRSPDTATSEDLRRYQLHMVQQQISPWSINSTIAGLRFFFIVTLEKPDLIRPLRLVTEPRKTPVVLSQEEVARLIEAAPGLKYKAACVSACKIGSDSILMKSRRRFPLVSEGNQRDAQPTSLVSCPAWICRRERCR
jgi:site-specific recombinase XerD